MCDCDLHRIHHSEEIREQSNNLGEILPWWDQIFGTLQREPSAGREGWRPGLQGCQTERSLDVGFMLAHPFLPDDTSVPAGRQIRNSELTKDIAG